MGMGCGKWVLRIANRKSEKKGRDVDGRDCRSGWMKFSLNYCNHFFFSSMLSSYGTISLLPHGSAKQARFHCFGKVDWY